MLDYLVKIVYNSYTYYNLYTFWSKNDRKQRTNFRRSNY